MAAYIPWLTALPSDGKRPVDPLADRLLRGLGEHWISGHKVDFDDVSIRPDLDAEVDLSLDVRLPRCFGIDGFDALYQLAGGRIRQGNDHIGHAGRRCDL